MSSENDVPLGDGSRRYYEEQFGDRIRQVKKGGAPAPRDTGGGSSNWGGRAGCGGAVAIFFVIRLIAVLVGSQSNTPSYNYTAPTPPVFDADMPKRFNDFGVKGQEKEELAVDLEEMLRQAKENNKANFGGANENILNAAARLTEADVPWPQGLCYRIFQASLRWQPSPGNHIWQMLPPSARKLIAKSAKGEPLDPDQGRELLESLSDLLEAAQFYDAPSFQNVPGVATMIRLEGIGGHPARGTPRFNRLLLEKCYPKQIVPLSKRGQLDFAARIDCVKEARLDLDQARRQYEADKP